MTCDAFTQTRATSVARRAYVCQDHACALLIWKQYVMQQQPQCTEACVEQLEQGSIYGGRAPIRNVRLVSLCLAF